MSVFTDFTAPDTGTTLATMDPAAVRNLWQKGIDVFEQTEDFFNPLCGGPSSVIREETKTSAGKGQGITYTVGSGFYGEGKIGDDRFILESDYEAYNIASYKLFVDFVRHGERHSERMEELMGMRGEIISQFNVEQGKWMGRLKSHQLFMMFIHQLPAQNIVFAGGAASLDALVAADTLDWDAIIQMGAIMQPLGGAPALVGKTANKQPLYRNIVVATTDALYSLDLDPTYKQLLRDTKVEREAELLFNGGYAAPKGHSIWQYNPINHDGVGPIGSPCNPQALLGNGFTAGTAALTITGGGNPTAAALTQFMYFKDFWNFAYKFIGSSDPTSGGSTVLAQDSNTHYFLICNPSNAPTDPGKFGMYSYTTGNNGNTLTTVHNLAASAGGTAVTTLGNVVWNTGVWSGKHTQTHPAGAVILPCNANGQIFGHSFMLGRGAALRGWGKFRNKRYTQLHEGGFIEERYIGSVFGQTPRQDRLGRVPSAIRLTHALQYAGINTPTVV